MAKNNIDHKNQGIEIPQLNDKFLTQRNLIKPIALGKPPGGFRPPKLSDMNRSATKLLSGPKMSLA